MEAFLRVDRGEVFTALGSHRNVAEYFDLIDRGGLNEKDPSYLWKEGLVAKDGQKIGPA